MKQRLYDCSVVCCIVGWAGGEAKLLRQLTDERISNFAYCAQRNSWWKQHSMPRLPKSYRPKRGMSILKCSFFQLILLVFVWGEIHYVKYIASIVTLNGKKLYFKSQKSLLKTVQSNINKGGKHHFSFASDTSSNYTFFKLSRLLIVGKTLKLQL